MGDSFILNSLCLDLMVTVTGMDLKIYGVKEGKRRSVSHERKSSFTFYAINSS